MTVTYRLKTPINTGSVTYEELNVINPKVKHLKKFGNPEDGINFTANAISVLCNIPPSAVEELGMEDWKGLSEIVASFFDPSRATSGAVEQP